MIMVQKDLSSAGEQLIYKQYQQNQLKHVDIHKGNQATKENQMHAWDKGVHNNQLEKVVTPQYISESTGNVIKPLQRYWWNTKFIIEQGYLVCGFSM